jgi:hypothetical protein
MKLVSFAAALFALSGFASADITLTGGTGNVLHTGMTLSLHTQSLPGGDVTIRRYDEWADAATVPVGTSTQTSIFTTGTQEIADDLTFAPQVGVGRLTNLGFAVANTGPAGSVMTTGQVRITFYDVTTGNVVPSVNGFTSFTANLPAALNLAANASARLSFGAAGAQALNGLGWYFDNRAGVYASLAAITAVGTGGFTVANFGQTTRNGGTVGTSTDQMVGVTAGPQPTGFFSFGGTPYADSAWFIETNDVPAPSSFALLGLGGAFAARRRR